MSKKEQLIKIEPKTLRTIYSIFLLLLFVFYYILILNLFPRAINDAKKDAITNKINKTYQIEYNQSDYLNNSCGLPAIQPDLKYSRIINGYTTRAHSYPWMASIGYNSPNVNYSHICGGSLISEQFILTAAHCVYSETIFSLVGINSDQNISIESMGRIYLGIFDRINDRMPSNTYFIKRIIVHPKYVNKKFNSEYDIALIQLTSHVTLSKNVSYVCLNKLFDLDIGQPLYAIGWGQSQENVSKYEKKLMQAKLSILDFNWCEITWNANPDTQLCAGTYGTGSSVIKDTCTGDSGGPLLVKSTDSSNRWFLIGIASLGNNPCDGLALYTKVKQFFEWITFHIK